MAQNINQKQNFGNSENTEREMNRQSGNVTHQKGGARDLESENAGGKSGRSSQ